jgi:hypothetical protein
MGSLYFAMFGQDSSCRLAPSVDSWNVSVDLQILPKRLLSLIEFNDYLSHQLVVI